VPSIEHRKSDQPNGESIGTTYTRGLIFFFWVDVMHSSCAYSFPFRPGGVMSFHRAELHGALLNRLPSCCGAFSSKRLDSYVQQPNDLIMLRFRDGSTATCDILLGADGVKSAVRKTMLHEAATWAESEHRNIDATQLRSLSEPRFSGFFAYRALIPSARLSGISPQHKALSSAVQVSCSLRRVSDSVSSYSV